MTFGSSPCLGGMDKAGRDKHKAMGIHEGWGKALDHLVALVKLGMKE